MSLMQKIKRFFYVNQPALFKRKESVVWIQESPKSWLSKESLSNYAERAKETEEELLIIGSHTLRAKELRYLRGLVRAWKARKLKEKRAAGNKALEQVDYKQAMHMHVSAIRRLHEVNPLRAAMYRLFLPDNDYRRTSFVTYLKEKGFFEMQKENTELKNLRQSGVFICLLEKKDDKGTETFVICRGTDANFDDTSAALNLDDVQPAYSAIEQHVKTIESVLNKPLTTSKKVTIVGHSLGGSKALHIAKIALGFLPNTSKKIDVCLYNSAPLDKDRILNIIEHHLSKKNKIAMRIIDWRVSLDPVNITVKDSPSTITHAAVVRFCSSNDLENSHQKMPFKSKEAFYMEADPLPEDPSSLVSFSNAYIKPATIKSKNDNWYECYVAKALHAAPSMIKLFLQWCACRASIIKKSLSQNQRSLLFASLSTAVFPSKISIVFLCIAAERVRRDYVENFAACPKHAPWPTNISNIQYTLKAVKQAFCWRRESDSSCSPDMVTKKNGR